MGLFPVEAAYTTSLVGHTLWGALGAAWAARRLGISERGAVLAGFAWSTSGFALIHLPHQWAYTVGSWMPWAWGLAWILSRGEGSRRTFWMLILVLTLQVLPGHFQMAFVTEVSVLLIALASGRRALRATLLVGLALVAMLPMAAWQLLPTLELARLSDATRGYEYLSGFAASPLHLISYVAPGLFHVSPLWRPLAWDVFHTAPEEHLVTIGLVPLFLATLAIRRAWKTDAPVRALTVVAVVTLLLSLGPYVPGFSALIRLPGFSFFRAPARWGMATSLALALIAGKGFDAWPGLPRVGRSLVRFCVVVILAVGLLIAGFELALASTRGAGLPAVASGFDSVLKAFPWKGDPSFRTVMAEAYRPQFDFRVQAALARVDGKLPDPPGPTLAGRRGAIYAAELGETAWVVAALLVVAAFTRKPHVFAAALIGITSYEAFALTRHRPFDLGPARSLVQQSPVLARVKGEGRGLRTLDPGHNLFLVAGADSAQAYRTLDLPSPGGLLSLARGPSTDPRTLLALQAVGVDLRVLDPFEGRVGPTANPTGWVDLGPSITDPALAGWTYGADLVRLTRAVDFRLIQPSRPSSQAWLVPSSGEKLAAVPGMTNPLALLDVLKTANPLPSHRDGPEAVEVEVRVLAPGASMVVLSRTFDPEWRGLWSSGDGDAPHAAKVVKVLGGWQGVAVPGPGRWTLRLEYEGRAASRGMWISSMAWSVWLMGFVGLRRSKRVTPVLKAGESS